MTVGGRPVITWTPYGRAQTVSILAEYMRRDYAAGVVDGWWLYLNTDEDQVDDLAYAHELAASHDWISLLPIPSDVPATMKPKQRRTGYAYRYFTDPTATYLRFDDDIVYVHDDAIPNLVKAKQHMPECLVAFPFVINNACASWYGQQAGVIPKTWGDTTLYCMCPVGWASGEFAVKLHTLLLDHIRAGTVPDLYLYQDMPLPPRLQFSVSCFACGGADYATLDPPGFLGHAEEENWHTVQWPTIAGKVNTLVGNAVVSHFTFLPQRDVVLATDLLDQYRELAEKL